MSYNDGVDYAMASPTASDNKGAIFICPNCFGDGKEGVFTGTIEVTGYQIGERFGHSLCAVDINGDGYDDLVVGAPLHSENNFVSSNVRKDLGERSVISNLISL